MLGVERATVIGHSLGGGVAMQFAYQYPERCERLVLVSPGGVAHEVQSVIAAGVRSAWQTWRCRCSVGVRRACSDTLFMKSLGWLGTDLGRDAGDMLRVFDALPDATARRGVRAHAALGGRLARAGDHDARPLAT